MSDKSLPQQSLDLDTAYKQLLTNIKTRLKCPQTKALVSVNHELIQFYGEVGKLITEQQAKSEWGDKLFGALSNDLNKNFSNTKGFSITNLKNMRAFALHYPDGEFSQALPDELT